VPLINEIFELKNAYSGEFSKKDDMKIQTFMSHLSRLGIEVV
jgi:hypothetical protein